MENRHGHATGSEGGDGSVLPSKDEGGGMRTQERVQIIQKGQVGGQGSTGECQLNVCRVNQWRNRSCKLPVEMEVRTVLQEGE